MNKPRVSIIVAMTHDRLIGSHNKLLWHIPEELKRFKQVTTGHPIIMGRKTHQSIGRILPDRTNIVISNDLNYFVDGGIVTHSLDEAIKKASEIDQNEIFIMGGGTVYEQALPIADKLYVTLVDGDFTGDVYFPDYSMFDRVIHKLPQESSGYTYTFYELEKSTDS